MTRTNGITNGAIAIAGIAAAVAIMAIASMYHPPKKDESTSVFGRKSHTRMPKGSLTAISERSYIPDLLEREYNAPTREYEER